MSDTEFELSGTRLTARASGALWWEEARILCVSDLHLGRSERLARRGGQLLPPYETRETLARLASEIAETEARAVVCLGDSFDDVEAARQLDEADRREITSLMTGRRWIWITGNHDPEIPEIGGSYMEELARGALTFRHIAQPRAGAGEVSGHFHPKMRLSTAAGTVSRPCFIHDSRRLILPAFGCYTGGLPATAPDLAELFEPDAVCILTGGSGTTKVPLNARRSA